MWYLVKTSNPIWFSYHMFFCIFDILYYHIHNWFEVYLLFCPLRNRRQTEYVYLCDLCEYLCVIHRTNFFCFLKLIVDKFRVICGTYFILKKFYFKFKKHNLDKNKLVQWHFTDPITWRTILYTTDQLNNITNKIHYVIILSSYHVQMISLLIFLLKIVYLLSKYVLIVLAWLYLIFLDPQRTMIYIIHLLAYY